MHSLTHHSSNPSDTEPESFSAKRTERLLEGTISLNHANTEWGSPAHLGGLLSSVCVFVDTLTHSAAKTITQYGMMGVAYSLVYC